MVESLAFTDAPAQEYPEIAQPGGYYWEDPLLPNVWWKFHELGRGRADDENRITQERRSREIHRYRTLYINGIKPIPSSSSTTKRFRFETGEASLMYINKQPWGITDWHRGEREESPPPPYGPAEDLFKVLRFAELKDVVALFRHDIGAIVLRKDWTEEALCDDIVVTAVYSRPNPVIGELALIGNEKSSNLRTMKQALLRWVGYNPLGGQRTSQEVTSPALIRTGEFAHPATYLDDLKWATVSTGQRKPYTNRCCSNG